MGKPMTTDVSAILAKLKELKSATLTDLRAALQMDSKQTLFYHLNRLMGQGRVERNEDKVYRLVSKSKEDLFVDVPFYGYAKAGANIKIFNPDNTGKYRVPSFKLMGNKVTDVAVWGVSGDSMEPTLRDASFVLFKNIPAGERPRDNEIIVCSVREGDEAGIRIKRFKALGKSGVLLSDNNEYNAIAIDEHSDFVPHGRKLAVL